MSSKLGKGEGKKVEAFIVGLQSRILGFKETFCQEPGGAKLVQEFMGSH